MTETTPSPLSKVITIDDERIKSHLDRVVRGSVEETLNALLDAEADRLCNAQRYERSEARRDTRAGHYERKLQTKAGEVSLRIPKLRHSPVPSQKISFTLSARLARKQKITPENGSAFNCSCTSAASPSIPLRKSTGFVATRTRIGPAESAFRRSCA